ncbi:MAG: PrsW family intramembrane metalloprotease [Chloroflexi bacterium]|nr:PrsW family intramembrane metalloprotease [Chloroflexota bacterium]
MQTQKTHVGALFLLIVFVVAALIYLCLAAVTGFSALISFFDHSTAVASKANIVGAFGLEFLLVLIPAYLNLRKNMGGQDVDHPVRIPFAPWQIGAGVTVIVAAFGLGYLVSDKQPFDAMFLPIFTVLAVLTPIMLLFGLAVRRLEAGTSWRFWSVFGLGMTIGPLILIVTELLVGVVMLVGVVAYVMLIPGLADELMRVSAQLRVLSDPTEAVMLLEPYLSNPKVLALAIGYIAVLVPLMEEVIKPIGVWIFARQIRTPAEGFVLGALSGAAYGLVESLGVANVSGADWVTLIAARMGTGLLHIGTSGLMGWGIVSMVQERRYLRGLLAYLGAVSMHGVWNGMTILFGFSTALSVTETNRLSNLAIPALGAMTVLAIGMFFLLLHANRRLRPAPIPAPAPASEPLPAPEPDPNPVSEEPRATE